MIIVRVHYKGLPFLPKREQNRLQKETWYELGMLWWRQMRPKHFTHAGAREYGYTPRSGQSGRHHRKGFKKSYTGRKLQRFGHTRPLEYTGLSKRLSRIARIASTSKGVRITHPHVRAFNFRVKGSSINMAQEFRAVSQGDKVTLQRLFKKRMEKRLQEFRGRKTVTLK